MGCPTEDVDLGLFVPPAVARAVKTANLGLFNPQSDVTKAFRTGNYGVADGFDWYSSNSLWSHTAGTWAGAVTVNGAGQSARPSTSRAPRATRSTRATRFSVANVNQVNLMTRRTTTTTATAGTKTFTITVGHDRGRGLERRRSAIYPADLRAGQPLPERRRAPGDGAALTLWPGTASPSGKVGKVGLALYPGAFFLVGMKLEEPEAVEICRQYQDPKTGIAIRFIRQWNNERSAMTNRFDMLFGAGVGLAEQCAVPRVRVASLIVARLARAVLLNAEKEQSLQQP
jgi:hypothetical protein